MATSTKTPSIGEMLRNKREKDGISKVQAAKDLGVARQTYYHWEDDYAVPDLDRVKSIAQYTGEPEGLIIQDILRRKGFPSVEVLRAERQAASERTKAAKRRTTGSRTIPG